MSYLSFCNFCKNYKNSSRVPCILQRKKNHNDMVLNFQVFCHKEGSIEFCIVCIAFWYISHHEYKEDLCQQDCTFQLLHLRVHL